MRITMLLKMTLQTSVGIVDVETLDGQPFSANSGIKVSTPEKTFSLTPEMRPLAENANHLPDALASQTGFIKQQFVDDVIKGAIEAFNNLSDFQRTLERRTQTKTAIANIYVLMKSGGDVVSSVRENSQVLFGDLGYIAVSSLVGKHSTVMPEREAEHEEIIRLVGEIRQVAMPLVNMNLVSPYVKPARVPNISVDEFTNITAPAQDLPYGITAPTAQEDTPTVDQVNRNVDRSSVADVPVIATVKDEPKPAIVDTPVVAKAVETDRPAIADAPRVAVVDDRVEVITVRPVAKPQRERDALDARIDVLDIHTGFTAPQPDPASPARTTVRADAPRTARAPRDGFDLAIPALDDAPQQQDLFAAPVVPQGNDTIIELNFDDGDDDFLDPDFSEDADDDGVRLQ